MSREHLLCAEVYHHLHKHIDPKKRIIFCLDGSAARSEARMGKLPDERVPDLCFFLTQTGRELRIEAKTVTAGGKVGFFGPGQPRAWCHTGKGKMKPLLWIGADKELKQFWVWRHDGFDRTLRLKSGEGLVNKGKHKGRHREVLRAKPDAAELCASIEELAARIVAYAVESGDGPASYRPSRLRHPRR